MVLSEAAPPYPVAVHRWVDAVGTAAAADRRSRWFRCHGNQPVVTRGGGRNAGTQASALVSSAMTRTAREAKTKAEVSLSVRNVPGLWNTRSRNAPRPSPPAGPLRALSRPPLQISIDNFGTGYASLAYLRRFPVDKLRIDISFTREITHSPDDDTIVMAIIAMGHSLNLKVIAEGVETGPQLGYLRRHHCDQIQGYYLQPTASGAGTRTAPARRCQPPGTQRRDGSGPRARPVVG